MSANWVDDVTKEEWQIWMKIARGASAKRQRNSSLGPEDYAASAIEKLVLRKTRPVNVEAWLRLVINRSYIDRNRRIERRSARQLHGVSEEELEQEVLRQFSGIGLGTAHLQRGEVERVMAILGHEEYALIIMHVQGYDNHEIAHAVGYKTNKIAATRIAQVKKKIIAAIGENPLG